MGFSPTVGVLALLDGVCDVDPRIEVFQAVEAWFAVQPVVGPFVLEPDEVWGERSTPSDSAPEELCLWFCRPSVWRADHPRARFRPGEAGGYAWAPIVRLSQPTDTRGDGTAYFVETTQFMACDDGFCSLRLISYWRIELNVLGATGGPVLLNSRSVYRERPTSFE